MSVVLPRPAYSPEGETGAAVTPPTVAPESVASEAPLAAPAAASPASPAAQSASPDSPRVDAGSSTPAVEPVKEAAPVEDKKDSEFPPTLMESAEKPAEPKPDAKDAKPADAPTEAQAAKPEAPPEAPPTYAFQLPEDVKADSLDQERMSAFTILLGEDRVKPENAQKLLDMHIAEVRSVSERVEKAIAERQWDVFRTQQNTWKDEVMADPTLGGSRFETAMRTCNTVVEQYGGSKEEIKALWDDLRATGMGNSPRLLKLFHRLGESLGREASMVPASPARNAQLSGRERGMARYSGTPSRSA